MSGKKRLSDHRGAQKFGGRQLRVIELIAQGLKDQEIAKELRVSLELVRSDVKAIRDRIGIRSRVELVLWQLARTQERDRMP